MQTLLIYAILSVAVILPANVLGQEREKSFIPVTDAMLNNPEPADWLNWRRTLDGWGYSPLKEIDRDNVTNLRLVWSWALESGANQTTPLVYAGVLYVANPGHVIHALDASTGEFLWEHRHRIQGSYSRSAQMRSLAIYEDLIIMNTVDAHIVGLDARSGEVRWDTHVGGKGDSYTFTSGPIMADGTVVAGLTGCERYWEDTCYIIGVDGSTGRELWRTSTIARPGDRGGDTWGDLPLLFRAGGDAWIPGSYDPVEKFVYWGTAQAKPWSRVARGTDGDALYTNSTLAIDPKDGKLEWYYQHIPGDTHDMDEAFERILIDYDDRSSVFTMGKLGILWELDRQTGRFVRANDLGYQNLVNVDSQTGKTTYRSGVIQDVGEEIYFCPSTGGFKSLRAMAFHPETQAFYIPLNLNCETAEFGSVERREGGGGTGGVKGRKNHFHPKSPDQMGEFLAMDMRTGDILWSNRRRVPYNTAALTTAGGLVFVGDWERHIFAYDVETGETLWQTRLTTMSSGFPITYAVGEKQYIAVGAGQPLAGASWASTLPDDLLSEKKNPRGGNGLFVFTLP